MAKGRKQGGEPDPDPKANDPSTEDRDDAKEETSSIAKERTDVIEHIIFLCGFAPDSTMVSYIDQEQWGSIYDVVTYHFKQIDDMNVIRDNGKFDAKPMLKGCRRLKCFLLYYRMKCDALVSTLIDEEVVMWKRSEFNDYYGSAKCQLDMAVAEGFATPAPTNVGKYEPNAVDAKGGLTAQEFRRGIKRDKSHYGELKDDKYFNSWNCGFVANVHDVGDVINLDDLVDYTVMKHDVVSSGDDDDKVKSDDDDALLAYMAGRTSSLGDIRQVLAAKSTPDKKNKNRKVNTSESVPDTVQVGDTTYYLNKGETINVRGHQYSAHMARVHYRVGQHDVAMMEKALVDRGANGGICGDDMLVLEGSERFVDVVGLAGHKVSQLRIVTSQALVSSHKGVVVATFHQMALLWERKEYTFVPSDGSIWC